MVFMLGSAVLTAFSVDVHPSKTGSRSDATPETGTGSDYSNGKQERK